MCWMAIAHARRSRRTPRLPSQFSPRNTMTKLTGKVRLVSLRVTPRAHVARALIIGPAGSDRGESFSSRKQQRRASIGVILTTSAPLAFRSSSAGEVVQHPERFRLHHPRRRFGGDFRASDRDSLRGVPFPARGTARPNQLFPSGSLRFRESGLFDWLFARFFYRNIERPSSASRLKTRRASTTRGRGVATSRRTRCDIVSRTSNRRARAPRGASRGRASAPSRRSAVSSASSAAPRVAFCRRDSGKPSRLGTTPDAPDGGARVRDVGVSFFFFFFYEILFSLKELKEVCFSRSPSPRPSD